MANFLVALISSRLPVPKFMLKFLLRSVNAIFKMFKGRNLWSPQEFYALYSALALTNSTDRKIDCSTQNDEFTILFVATSKDFVLLPEAIKNAINSMEDFDIKEVKVYVPDSDIGLARALIPEVFSSLIEVRSENHFFNFKLLSDYFSKTFPGRGNWCCQQILKLYSVLNCQTKFALVVDADTMLLRKRPWVNADGNTILMPSLEYHLPYYLFLRLLGLEIRTPLLSFVPHHMAYRVATLKDILTKFSLSNLDDYKSNLTSYANPEKISPFCIDYELYGQSEYGTRGAKTNLVRWANLGINIRFFLLLQKYPSLWRMTRYFFNSISVHLR
jgi:hypothetical protein